jgi:hypothetical protein
MKICMFILLKKLGATLTESAEYAGTTDVEGRSEKKGHLLINKS